MKVSRKLDKCLRDELLEIGKFVRGEEMYWKFGKSLSNMSLKF